MSLPPDPLIEEALRLLDELRTRGREPRLGIRIEELLTGGYARALALEGMRRRLRVRALELSVDEANAEAGELVRALAERELRLAAHERELRELLRELLREVRASGDEAAAQRLH